LITIKWFVSVLQHWQTIPPLIESSMTPSSTAVLEGSNYVALDDGTTSYTIDVKTTMAQRNPFTKRRTQVVSG